VTSITAVICTKGRPDVLDRALAAVRACDPPPDAILVIDGDPAGSAGSVAARRGARYLRNEPGLTRQRNRAIDEATTEVLAFFDDDAQPAPDVFACLRAAYADAGVVGVTGRVLEPGDHTIGGRASPLRRLLTGRGRPGTFTRGGYPRRFAELDGDCDVEFMQGAFLTVRTTDARAVRFDEDLPGYGLAEDEDFSCRLSRRGRIRYLTAAVVHHENLGFGDRDSRAFNRDLVVNRWHIFRKNFEATPRSLTSFAWTLTIVAGHRAVNRDWRGIIGLVDGIRAARSPSG